MKKIFFIAGACTLSILICTHANAQQNLTQEYAGTRIAFPDNAGSKHYINDINIKAVRDFKQRYKDASNEFWYKNSMGEYSVSFTLNGIITRLLYTKHGEWYGTVKLYTEDKLPFIIRDKVKSKYYDYTIGFINEILTVDTNKLPMYLVQIKYGNDIKVIRIYDDEMEVWKQFKRS